MIDFLALDTPPWHEDIGALARGGCAGMDKDEIIATLAAAGLDIVEEDRNGNDTGWRLRSTCGAIVNLYDSGKIDIQGKNRDPVKAHI